MFGRRWTYLLLHPWIIVTETAYQLRWAWQRVFRGWDDRATYGIDSYLVDILPQLIAGMQKYHNSYPVGLEMDEWQGILDEIAEGFNAGQQLIGNDFPAWLELWNSPEYNGGDIPDPDTFWPKLREQQDEAQKKFDRGMDLFVEYFFSLWD